MIRSKLFENMPFPSLFALGRIGGMVLKNRLVMPPMVRNYADAHGRVTPRYVNHIERIARGGVGMMILEASYIRPDGRGFVNELGIHSDALVQGLRKLAVVAHRHGSKIGVQLYHAGRQTSSKTTGTQPVAPSPIPDPTVNEIPHELTTTEIAALVRAYGAAALRAKKAGMDFVEIHGAHGYLITQFLSPFSNRRTDGYGGSFDNRMRFLAEAYAAVRDAVGERFPIVVRLSGDELVAGGIRLSDTVRIAKRLEALGADALHISVGNYASYARGMMIPPMAIPDGPLLHLAAGVKKAVKIPVIAVAKIRSAAMGDRAIKQKQADFIAVGRTLLADPEWPNKVRAGQFGEIMPCIACNQACISRLFAQKDVLCTVNPSCGRERQFAKKAKAKKRVLVIGGGSAGLSAARTAAELGHAVTLYEKHGQLGGQLAAASAMPHRPGWSELRDALVRDVKRLRVTVRLNAEFVPGVIRAGQYDAAIIATGSTPSRSNIPGVGRTHVIIARDLLEGWVDAVGRVVVVGGGCMGTQTAEALAAKGHRVTIVEAAGAVATDAPVDDRALLLGRLKKHRVGILTDTKIMAVGPQTVSVEGPQGPKMLRADTVVLCLGSAPNDGMTAELRKKVRSIQVVGDAKQPRRVTDAVAEGALAALAI